MTQNNFDLLNKWLRNLKDIYFHHRLEVDSIENEEDRVNKLVEINVIEQVNNLVKTSVVQKAWKHKQAPKIHGWVYDMKTGLLNSVIELNHESPIDETYRFDNL
jgi:carbonic anhydrase